MTDHDELVEAKRERDRLKAELTQLRGLVGRAILSRVEPSEFSTRFQGKLT